MKKFTMLFVCLVMLGVHIVNAQQRTITGTVTSSEDGMSIPGVSVAVKGTTVGTITNIDGKYSLGVPQDAQTLVYSFVGMKTKEVVVGTTDVIDVVMEPEVIGVDEVVVTAFGISREKKAITYQTETVSGEDLMSAQSTVAATGLVGKVAGLQVNVQDNGVKPNTQILLRGLRSVSGNNEALIVIDGAIASSGAFADLNPNDIESVNALKGATAAALYGSGAANGALIVTTKSGKKGEKFTVGVKHATTFETVSFMPHFQTEYGTGWDGVYDNIENTNWGPRFDGKMRQIGPELYDGTYQQVPYAPVEDNVKDFFNTGSTIQNTIYLSGGDETGSYYMSVGNQNTTGIVPDDTYKKTTFRVNANKKIGSVELRVNTSYFFDEQDVVGGTIGDQDRPLYWFLLNTPANIPLTEYKDWDNPNSWGHADRYYNAYYQNPYWAIGTNRDNDKTQRLVANASASWDILENINLTGRFGTNTSSGRGKNWRAYQDYDATLQPSHGTVSSFTEDFEFQDRRYTADALLSGDFDINEDISLKVILGTALSARQYRESKLRAENLSIPDFYDISNGTGSIAATPDAEDKRTVGFFGDFTVGYQKWAYLNLTGRQDYTSTLSADNNSYFYPAASVSVILSDAIPALSGIPVLSLAKITASNSTVYNDLNPYAINERYSQNKDNDLGFPFPYGTINGFYKAKTAVDTEIKKEKINSTELGANFAFLKGRIEFDATYFLTKTTDLITRTTPSLASASESFLTNIGELKGTGFELSLGADVLRLGDFNWHVDLNYSKYETEVVSIKEGINEISIDTWTGYGVYAVVGEAFPQLKATSYERDPQGNVVIDATSGNPIIGDIKNMGKTTPDYTVGLQSHMSYKGVTLSASFDVRGGHVYYSQGMDRMEFTGRSMESVQSNRKDFVWPNSVYNTGTADNPVYVENTDIEISGGKMDFWQNQYNEIKENYVKDGTAIKMRELSLNYELPKSLIANTKVLSKVTVGFVARNVFTVLPKEKFRFSDPEFNNTRDDISTANGIGIGGYYSMPPTRTFGFSINVEF